MSYTATQLAVFSNDPLWACSSVRGCAQSSVCICLLKNMERDSHLDVTSRCETSVRLTGTGDGQLIRSVAVLKIVFIRLLSHHLIFIHKYAIH
jgi:hypothetical protein